MAVVVVVLLRLFKVAVVYLASWTSSEVLYKIFECYIYCVIYMIQMLFMLIYNMFRHYVI